MSSRPVAWWVAGESRPQPGFTRGVKGGAAQQNSLTKKKIAESASPDAATLPTVIRETLAVELAFVHSPRDTKLTRSMDVCT